MLLNNKEVITSGMSEEQFNVFLSERMQLIEQLIVNKDHEALVDLLQEYHENIGYLKSKLRRLGESIINMNHMQQYVHCLT